MSSFRHERVVVATGIRSGLTIVVAVHSTALGQAAGGCRMWRYANWLEGLDDALRLSEAMTLKSALAEMPLGGGKSVIAVPHDHVVTAEQRREVMLDLGDVVESLGGIYGVAEDVGTTAEDMLVVAERTRFAYCLPPSAGGSGEPSEPTAVGVHRAIAATCSHLFASESVAGRRLTIVGLGQVGSRLARRLSAEGATLVVSDIDDSKRALASELGARWVEPADALFVPADVLVPAALGGVITPEVALRLDCRAIVGPANNQLASEDVADSLAARGIVWAPDFLVNAGGVIYGGLVEVGAVPPAEAMARVERIGDTLANILASAEAAGTTPFAAAVQLARSRVAAAKVARETIPA